MKRLLSTARWDFRLQYRNGFYYAAAFVVAINVIVINQLPGASVNLVLPVILLENILINAFYFVGGLVLLEKGEGTLEVQIVTPLRTGEYLISKSLTLTALSIVESLLIVGLTVGLDFRPSPLLIGIVTLATFFTLIGFLAVARYDSINEYLFPSFLFTAALSLPLVAYFGGWESWALYLHPIQAPLVLLEASFFPVETWEWVYGILYMALWIALAYRWSLRAFYRFVIVKEGVRRRA
jgi:fluoroquinolone transport system permease protein